MLVSYPYLLAVYIGKYGYMCKDQVYLCIVACILRYSYTSQPTIHAWLSIYIAIYI